jgi:chromosome partitioning protein
VGKTATVANMGACLAERGRHVLLVDLDPQAALTGTLGLSEPTLTLVDVIGAGQPGKTPARAAIQNVSERLDLLPSSLELANCEMGLNQRLGRETVLKKALANLAYDFCLIDCPPSLGLLTVNGLTAADAVLIPTQPQAADLRALRQFLDTLDAIRGELAPGLALLGVLVTFYDGRLNHHKDAIEAMQAAGLPLLQVRIGRSIRIAEACGAGQPLAVYDPSNPQNENYRKVAELVDLWQNDPT